MIYPVSQGQFTIEIQKSKFISTLHQVKTINEIKSILKELQKSNPQARHIVYAYTLGKSGEILGKNDDGEPSGTAGNPTLTILTSHECTGALITTVRYFGGIKLGSGGLTRAYSEAALGAFEHSSFSTLQEKSKITINLPYTLYKIFISLVQKIDENGFFKLEENFSEHVTLILEFPSKYTTQLEELILDLGKGSLTFSIEKIPGLFD